ncbi:MAG: hypothetical protein FIA89_07470 [Geobacter sp.]|nr:hypothetical protein [Geobacter sp.]
MHVEENQEPLPPEIDFCVDDFRPEDAEGLTRLFQSVYGDGYPIRLFYDPQAIISANADGSYYSLVARLSTGEIIGAQHLYRSAPYQALYEWGVGLVLKEYRSAGVFSRLAVFLHDDFLPRTPHIEEVFGESVCNHTHMQKAVLRCGYCETAIEVALMPSEAYRKEQSAAGRVATICSFHCRKPRPQLVYLPAAYDPELREIYSGLTDTRELASAVRGVSAGKATKAEMSIFDFAQVARIAVHEAGDDLGLCIAAHEEEAATRKVVVFQVWLNLSEPWIDAAVETLRAAGYFFGGVLPRWFDNDGLLMQKLLCPPDFDGIVPASERANRLLEVIRSDWERVACINQNR